MGRPLSLFFGPAESQNYSMIDTRLTWHTPRLANTERTRSGTGATRLAPGGGADGSPGQAALRGPWINPTNATARPESAQQESTEMLLVAFYSNIVSTSQILNVARLFTSFQGGSCD